MSDEEFVDAARGLGAKDRADFLERECPGPERRRRIEALLAGDTPCVPAEPRSRPDITAGPSGWDATGPDAFTGADSSAGGTPVGRANAAVGTVVAGRYRLVAPIGEGGMGTVYLAEQSEPVKRRVALKLIKAGLDSRFVVGRFDAERQALALMDHPNIARIYDGGVTESRLPFFVMELVHGEPLTAYCDRKRLSVEARLRLFVQVCSAVQHAHQKGVIHRDLKPGNVLVGEVDGRPTPKVIDFGVAKATEQPLTDMSVNDYALVGTPAYMSPEQADPASMDIDTRSDVYALGVILYELLTGTLPLDAKPLNYGGLLETLRMVREEDPPRPSAKLGVSDALPDIAAHRGTTPAGLSRQLRGELDWVVMKALEKDRERRYETAASFAADVSRYLSGEVVQAHPPRAAYRLAKFVRRNRPQVVAAGLLFLALLGGVVGTTWQMFRAEKAERDTREQLTRTLAARDTARRRYDIALAAFNDMIGAIQDKLGTRPNTLALRRELLVGARGGLKKLLADADRDEYADSDLVWSFYRMGTVEVALGNFDNAEREFRAGYDLARRLADDAADLKAQHNVSVGLFYLGQEAMRRKDFPRAATYFGKKERIDRTMADAEPDNPERLRSLHQCLGCLGELSLAQGQTLQAMTNYEDKLRITRRLAEMKPADPAIRRDVAVAHEMVGNAALYLKRTDVALANYRDSYAAFKRLHDADPDNILKVRDLGVALTKLGNVCEEQDKLPEARDYFGRAVDAMSRLSVADPQNVQAKTELFVGYDNLASVEQKLGAYADAAATLKKGRAVIVPLHEKKQLVGQFQHALRQVDEQIAHCEQMASRSKPR